MVTGVRLILVQVEDMERATRFYQETLGGQVAYGSPHWTSVQLGGVTFGLHPTIHEPHAMRDVGHKVCLATDSLADARARLTEVGVYVAPIDHETPNGPVFDFEDTEGNGFQMMQPR